MHRHRDHRTITLQSRLPRTAAEAPLVAGLPDSYSSSSSGGAPLRETSLSHLVLRHSAPPRSLELPPPPATALPLLSAGMVRRLQLHRRGIQRRRRRRPPGTDGGERSLPKVSLLQPAAAGADTAWGGRRRACLAPSAASVATPSSPPLRRKGGSPQDSAGPLWVEVGVGSGRGTEGEEAEPVVGR